MASIFSAKVGIEGKKILCVLLRYIQVYSEDLTFQLSATHIDFQTSDSSHCCMLSGRILRNFFDHDVEYKGHGSFGVNVSLLLKVLKNISTEFFMQYDERSAKLFISGTTATYKISCIESNEERFEFPEEEISQMTKINIVGDKNMTTLFSMLKNWRTDFKADSVGFDIDGQVLRVSTTTDQLSGSEEFITGNNHTTRWSSNISIIFLNRLLALNSNERIFFVSEQKKDFPIMFIDRFPNIRIRSFLAPLISD